MTEPRTMINGVPAEKYGLWCRHGRHLLVADPADTSDYPGCIVADPWPCLEPECTLAEIERQICETEVEADAQMLFAAEDLIEPLPRYPGRSSDLGLHQLAGCGCGADGCVTALQGLFGQVARCGVQSRRAVYLSEQVDLRVERLLGLWFLDGVVGGGYLGLFAWHV